MTPVGAQHDPRSIITPDAFHLAPNLLGLKLASPRRRLAAILIDLAVISFLTAVTRSFALILGIVAAVLFIRLGFKRTSARGTAANRAMRASIGCLGVFIATLTGILWVAFGPAFQGRSNDDDEPPDFDGAGLAGGGPPGRIFDVLGPAIVRSAFEEAESLADAEDATRDLIEASEELGIPPADLRALLIAAVPENADWADEAPALFDRLLPAPEAEPVESRDVIAVRDEVSLYTTDEALEAYAALLRADGSDSMGPMGPLGPMDLVRRDALEARLLQDIAADTLRVLEGRVADLAEDVREQETEIDDLEDQLEAVQSRGFFTTLRGLLDELGFGFGWASLYFTVLLSWWKGQTVGKRLTRVRVLRLDGGPITWWVAFERAGGYAAGLATGFLGFAQIFWDANRQAIHDRIVGTVVALDPPQKILDWEAAP